MGLSSPVLQSLFYKYRPDYAGLLEFSPIKTGKFNQSYWVESEEGQYVIRVAPSRRNVFVFYERGMMAQEPQIHALVRAETAVPVPRILGFDDSHTLIDHDYMLMDALPGRPLTEMPQSNFEHVLGQIGEMLAEVHQLHTNQYGYLGTHKPMQPQMHWVDAFAIMWNKLVDDIVGIRHYSKAESVFVRGLLEEHLRLFDRKVPSSLLHMDIWHQNILVDEQSQVTGLLDWDRALWGDPEIEFAVLDYCGLSGPAFWEGYGQERDTSTEAKIRQVFYLLYELQKYIVIEQGRRRNAQKAHQYKQQVFSIISQSFEI